MTPIRRLLYRARWPLAVLAGTLVLTRLLTAPGVQPADSGEFQLVARELGIAHPPGYALYTMAAHAWGRAATIPAVGRALGADPALWTADRPFYADPWTWAINAFSALLAVLTLALVYRTAYLLTGARVAGLAAALALALVPTFLIQSAIANIRMPTALFTALLVYLTCRWLADETARPADAAPQTPDWRLAGLALVAGLAVGHHGSLAFVALSAALVVIARRPRVLLDGRTLATALGGLGLSLLPQLFLPVRDFQNALFAEGHLRTLAGVVNHVSAADFRGDLLSLVNVETLLDRGGVVANVFVLQFWPALLALAALGLVWLARRDRWAAVLVAVVLLLTALAALIYKAPQTVEYLMPAYVAMSVTIGVSFGALWRWRRVGRVLAGLGVGVLVAGLWLAAPTLPVGARAWRVDWLYRVFDPNVTPPRTTILAAWHYAMPLTYVHRYWAERPDMTVQYVYPEGAETPGETWLRRIREAAGPFLLTNRPREVVEAEVHLWPVPGTPFALGVPPTAVAPSSRLAYWHEPAVFGDRVAFSRYTNRTIIADALKSPVPKALDLDLEFAPVKPVTETLTVVAQLLDDDTGMVIAQADRAIPPSRWNDPRGMATVLPLVPYRGAAPVNRLLRIGVYRNGTDGPELLPIGGQDYLPLAGATRVDAPASVGATATGSGIPYGNAMTLVETRVERLRDQLLVDLTWRADRDAAASDYTVSVQAHGDGWTAQDDGTPALGAIPTLKWLPGMVIHDRHRLQLPAGLPLDAPFHVTVGVYDAFSLEPLPITDAERVRQGQGQAAEVYRQGE